MTFVDTNVFVYCVDVREQSKRAIAWAIVESAIKNPAFRISVQVLNEFSNIAFKKFSMDAAEIKEYLEATGEE